MEAIKQAALLRARGLQRAATDVPKLPVFTTGDTVEDSDNAEPRSEPDGMPSRSLRNRKARGTEWLLRRHTTLYELSADESIDELSRSRLDTPSRPSQVPLAQLPEPSPSAPCALAEEPAAGDFSPEGSTSMNLTQSDGRIMHWNGSTARPSIGSYQEHWECFAGNAPSDAVEVRQDEASLIEGSHHTAPEATELEADTHAAHGEGEADSQTRLLRSQGINVAPRRAWTSTNGSTAPQQSLNEDHGEDVESATSSNASALRASVQESATHAGEGTKAKRAKSSGHQQPPHEPATTSRRRSAPSESQNAATQVESLPVDQRRHMGAFRAYTEAEAKAKGDETPFMFRKHTSKGSRADSREGTVVEVSTRQRRSMKFHSSQDGAEKGTALVVDAGTPRLDVSIGNDSFGKKLNLALTDEHLNALLPVEPGTASALRRSLRQECQEGDEQVEITRMEDEPPSSQVEGMAEARRLSLEALDQALARSNAEEAMNAGEELTSAEPAQTQWPGTQALLSKAHADFFSSPVKAPNHEAAGIPKSTTPNGDPALNNTIRKPLRTFSQEPDPLPSTQAMVEAWSPWSTVKKPKGNSARAAHTSTVTANSVGDGSRRRSSLRFSTSTTTDSPTAHLADEGTRRGSGLRFSTSTMSSPGKGTGVLPFTAVTKPVSRSQPRDKASPTDRTVTPTPILRKRGGIQRSSTHTNTQHTGQIDGETTRLYDPPTIIPGSAPAVLEPSADVSAGTSQSGFQYDQRLLMVRDDSDVGRTIDEHISFLDMTELDGVF